MLCCWSIDASTRRAVTTLPPSCSLNPLLPKKREILRLPLPGVCPPRLLSRDQKQPSRRKSKELRPLPQSSTIRCRNRGSFRHRKRRSHPFRAHTTSNYTHLLKIPTNNRRKHPLRIQTRLSQGRAARRHRAITIRTL